MIPEGWLETNIAQVATEPVSYGVVQTGDPVKNGVPCVRVVDLASGFLRPENMIATSQSISDSYKRTVLTSGDLMIALRGIIGYTVLVPPHLAGCNLTRGIARISPDYSMVTSEFLFHSLNGREFQTLVNRQASGSALQEISIATLRSARVLLPPIPEQRRIAEILSTWDHAIETVEALITNARAQKQALMQSLLTGKKRLPGFTTDWIKTSLDQVAKVLVSNVDKKSAAAEQAVRLCNYMDVYRADQIKADMNFMVATATVDQVRKFGLRVGDVLITKDSETPEDIAIPAYVASTAPDLVCGYHLAIIRPKKGVDGQFLKYFFEHPHTRYFFATRANGATRFGLTIDAITTAPITLPEHDEQRRIAEVIAAAEQEIESLKPIEAALRQEKSALMQQLLTGKRRVKVPEQEIV